jgi:glycosyltransferase involved in cell wall biosynthesis
MNVSYHHFLLKDYSEISQYYHVLDLYLVTSREEGGPRAVLESMASGIPLVSTLVGQAIDLVKHGENGWMVDVEDVEGLAYWAKYIFENIDSIDDIKSEARKTAEQNCYEAQIPLWTDFMDGFVNY